MVIALRVTPLKNDVIRLKAPKKKKKSPLFILGVPRFTRSILTSPITTVGLGTILGGLIGGFGGAVKGAGIATGGVTLAAAAATSPRIRKGLGLLSPTKAKERGQALGALVEDPTSFLEKVRGAARKAAPAVLGVGALTGAAVVGRTILERRRAAREALQAPAIPGLAPAVIGGAPFVPLPPGLSQEPSIATTPAPVEAKAPTAGGQGFTNIIQIQNVI